MARRAPANEKPFRPLDVSVLHEVLQHRAKSPPASQPGESSPANVIPLREVVSAPVIRAVAPAAPGVVLNLPRLEHERRIHFTREQGQAFDRLVHGIAARLQTPVKASHVLRALTSLVLAAEAQVLQRAGEHGPLIRPPNGEAAALEKFERELSLLLAKALRDAGVPR